MQCPSCGAQNVAEYRYCGSCGEPRVVDVSRINEEPTFAGATHHDYAPLPPAEPVTQPWAPAGPPPPAPPSVAPPPVASPSVAPPPVAPPAFAPPAYAPPEVAPPGFSPSAVNGPQRLAAVGNVSENETYIGHRLSFKIDVESKLSGEVSPRVLVEFFIRAVIAAVIAFFASGVLAIIFAVAGSYSFAVFVLFAFPTVVFYGSFFVPFREALSEWELMVDGKAASAESAYAAIYTKLLERQAPVTTTPRRFRTVGDPSVNNFLVVQDGINVVYISVFAYGTGLYLGWGLWRKRSPFRMMLRFLKDLLGGLFGRQQDFAGTLGSQRVRAMREAVHSSVREAIDAVNSNTQISMVGTFGHEIAIESVDLGLSAAEAPAPPVSPRR